MKQLSLQPDLDAFLNEISASNDDELVDICCRELLHGNPYILNNDYHAYYYFRKRIAEHFEINYFDIFIVGSAKLGFSPQKRKDFDLDSDVDVAIASPTLFEAMMQYIYDFQMSIRESRKSVTASEMRKYHDFLEYVAIGWIRPDKLPSSFQIESVRKEWFEFFLSLSYGKSEIGNYKVSAGVFKSFAHLQEYNLRNLKRIRSMQQAVEVANE